ncbi:Ig-like domain-containing protein [Nocardioides sp. GCM10027113]|uniref:Ig-like domain-containing protein n=1 Tax=unclassified Nocardioides TaxID=2615069 RepID=UPI0036159672
MTDREGGPLDGIDVSLFRWNEADQWWDYVDGSWVRTDAGEATLEIAEPGEYVLGYNDDSGQYRPAFGDGTRHMPDRGEPGTFTIDDSTSGSISVHARLTVAPPTTSQITGVVRDQTGQALDNIQVRAFEVEGNHGYQAVSELTYASETPGGPQHGFFRLHVPAGDYWLSFEVLPDDERDLGSTWRPEDGGTLTVADGETLHIDDVTMPRRPGSVEGAVTDELGQPLNGVQVELENVDNGHTYWAQTGPRFAGDETQAGFFRLDLPAGRYTVTFDGRWVDGETRYGRVSYNGGEPVDVVGRQTLTLDTVALPEQVTRMFGVVRDEDGKPLDGIQVQVFSEDDLDTPVATELTYADPREGGDQHGFYGFELPPGKYVVRFSTVPEDERALEPSELGPIRLEGGESRWLGVQTMYPANGTLTGRVTDAEGSGLGGLRVIFREVDRGYAFTARTGDATAEQPGSFSRALTPGTYAVEVRGGNVDGVAYKGAAYLDGETITIASFETLALGAIALTARETAVVEGSVVDTEGIPLAAHLTLFRATPEGLERQEAVWSAGDHPSEAADLPARSATAADGVSNYRFDHVDRGGIYTIRAVHDDEVRWLGGAASGREADTFEVSADIESYRVDPIFFDPCQGEVISNGTVSLGVNCLGQLNLAGPKIGLQYDATGNDGTQAGCECEGWGVADAESRVRGFANNSAGISKNLMLEGFDVSADGRSAKSVVNVDDTFRVTHVYVPSEESDNVYDVKVSVQNISDAPMDLRYRRVMDWDIEPTAFNEYVTMVTGEARELVYNSNDGFASANPLRKPSRRGLTGDFSDAGPDDHGALFDFQFPALAPGETQEFRTFYGAAGDEQAALAGLAAVKAEAYSLGQPSTEDGPTLGTPNTFLFGFAGVGGSPVLRPPTAVDDTLDAISGETASVDVLANDTDPDRGDVLSLVPGSVSEPEHGSVTCEGGVCSYTSEADFTGTDRFTYEVTDGAGGTDEGEVVVTVHPAAAAENVAQPQVTGEPRVGGLLTTSDGDWDREDLVFGYQWLRDGQPIAGATERDYVPTVADLGAEVAARVTARRAGAAPVPADSTALLIEKGTAPVSTPGAGPYIPTALRAGERVTAQPGTWSPTADRYSYQWLLDGAAIAGANSRHHIVRSADVDGVLSVRVLAHRAGHSSGEATSNGADVLRSAAPTNFVKPSISGVAAEAETLAADPGEWSFPDRQLAFQFQWVNNGSPILGATGDTYTVASADGVEAGDSISVSVTATKIGHENGSAESDSVVVGSRAADNLVAPALSGEAKAGRMLTIEPGTWSPADVDLSYEWYAVPGWADGDSARDFRFRLWGVESDSYEIPSWLAGYRIHVEETAAGAAGTAPVTVASAPTGLVTDIPALYNEKSPVIAGTPRVGSLLTLDLGTWVSYDPDRREVEPDGYTYEWYVGGDRVGTGDSYTPVAADGGKWLSVFVAARKAEHRDGWGYAHVGRILGADEGVGTLDLSVQRATAPRNPVQGASVTVCRVRAWDCQHLTTNEDGQAVGADGAAPTLLATDAGIRYSVRVDAPWRSDLFGTVQEVVVRRGEVASLPIELEGLVPMPPSAELPDSGRRFYDEDETIPSLFYATSQTLQVSGCAGVEDPTWTVVFSNGAPSMTGTMTEDPEGQYTGTIPGFSATGLATIQTNVPAEIDGECAEKPTSFTVYIDPSGIVADQYGRPIPGAMVTLLKEENGAFLPVEDGDESVMDPTVNVANPSRTTETGFFRWDVTPDDYKVSVSDARSGGVLCDVTTTNAMTVPPPRLDLLIKVQCPGAQQPQPKDAPVLTGTPRVGQVLTATPGGWNGGLEHERIEWVRDGEVVGTGDRYTLTGADQGKRITVRSIARRPDYVQENGTGAVVGFDPVSFELQSATVEAAPGGGGGGGGTPEPPQAPKATASPSVTGVAKVGRVLTAHPGTWDVDGLAFAYQWRRDGEPIAGATGADYRAMPADRGRQLSVSVTATAEGRPEGRAASTAVLVGIGDAATALSSPVITGDTGLGDTLTVSDGRWDATGLQFGYQWFRDGEPIAGGTAATYAVTRADQGRDLMAVVTAARDGHADGSASSDEVAVPEPPASPTRTRVRIPDPVVRAGERALVKVNVSSPGNRPVVGQVRLRVDGMTMRTVDVERSDDGRLTVRLPLLSAGSHRVLAVYAGTERFERSRSEAVVLNVRKAHGRPMPSLG